MFPKMGTGNLTHSNHKLRHYDIEKLITATMVGQDELWQLLLAQSIHSLGENFEKVSKLLADHPLLQDHDKYTAEQCESAYNTLLDKNGIEKSNESINKVPVHVNQLAQACYAAYSAKLEQDMKRDEQEFKEALAEVEKLSAGVNFEHK